MIRAALAAAALLLAAAPAAVAQSAPAAPVTNPARVPAGAYQLDPTHTSVIARVRHMGISDSTFRFTGASGTLQVNPQNPAASTLEVTVDARTIQTFSREFETELQGPNFLAAEAHPEIRFVSRSAQVTGPNAGRVTGELTFRGVTRPATMAVRFVGATQGMRREQRVGFHGRMTIDRGEFGLTQYPGAIGNEIELVVDAEFAKQP